MRKEERKMSETRWTDAQLDAINARSGPLLVSAAAGSGKTAVLVQRVIEIITDKESPVDIDRFLVVTFTRAAAGEMKQRIAKALSDLLKDDPFNKALIRQQLLLPKAQISTIDSFCSSLAKEFFHVLDIPADFRIIDESESGLMMTTALDNVFNKMYSSDRMDFDALAEAYSDAHDDKTLRDTVLKIYAFMNSQPFHKTWIKEKLANYDVEGTESPFQTVWGEELLKYISLAVEFAKQQAQRTHEKACLEPMFEKAQEITENEVGMISEFSDLIKIGDWDAARKFLYDLKFDRMSFSGTKGKNATDERIRLSKQITANRKEYKDIINEKLKPLFAKDSSSFMQEIESLRPTVSMLFELVDAFSEEYSRLKRERGVADYSDLSQWTLRLLVRETENGIEPTREAKQIAGRYDFVMVDEYQDANMIQDIIFKAVSDNDRRLFVVGDVKQSIYRFRQAMPEIFIGRKDSSFPYNNAAPVYPAKINLDANFRSRKGVTECVNYVFSKLMSREIGELDYTKEEALDPKANYPDEDRAATSFHLIETGDLKDDDKTVAEVRYIGDLIKKMMKSETVTENGIERAPVLSDFCILLRSDKAKTQIYIRELMKMGIPSVSEKGGSFFSQPEIRLMLSLLRAVDNPARDVPLAAALLSPIFNFSAEEIAALHAKYPMSGLYEIMLLEAYGEEEEESLCREKALSFCEMFDELRSCGSNITADEFIRRIYNETMLPEIVRSGEDGEFRQKNLRLLLEYAKQFEESGFRGVSGFIGFFDRLAQEDKDLNVASRVGSGAENAVKICTIHKSKGLQFPFCIVSDLVHRFNTRDSNEDVILHNRIGVGVNCMNFEKMYYYKGITRTAAEKSVRMSMISEELRILYVAMTRAKERLILTAAVDDVHDTIVKTAGKIVCVDGKIAPYFVLSANTFCEHLLSCLLISRSGQKLRDMYGLDVYVDEDDTSRWDIVLYERETENNAPEKKVAEEKSEIEALEETAEVLQENDEEEEPQPCESEIEEQLGLITGRLQRRYKYAKACSLPVKVAASAVAERNSGNLYGAVSRPSFMNEGRLTAAQKGTALHTFAQYCDFEKARISVDEEKARLVSEGYLSQAQADCIPNEKAERFLHSSMLDEMMSAQMLEREYQYMAEIPAGLADPSLRPPYSDERIILQGAIDCLYELDGELVIVDYKTDRGKTADELAQHYSPQLRLYKYAAEQIFGREVSRCVIYSFELGEEIELDL